MARPEGTSMPMVELTEQELAELKKMTEEKDAAAAVRTAVKEYARHSR